MKSRWNGQQLPAAAASRNCHFHLLAATTSCNKHQQQPTATAQGQKQRLTNTLAMQGSEKQPHATRNNYAVMAALAIRVVLHMMKKLVLPVWKASYQP